MTMIEPQFGITAYKHVFRGVGGRIKVEPHDFQVMEVDDAEVPVEKLKKKDEPGLYIQGILNRVDMSHDLCLKRLKQYFKVQESSLKFAGIKDKKAVVCQKFSVFQPRANIKFEEVELNRNLKIRTLGRKRSGVFKGGLCGNIFRIKLREYQLDESIEALLSNLKNSGTYNYYGYQRFGGQRAITANLGEALCKNDFKKAIQVYLGGENASSNLGSKSFLNSKSTSLRFTNYLVVNSGKIITDKISATPAIVPTTSAEKVKTEFPSLDKFRKLWRETEDPELLLSECKHIPQIEYDILCSLQKFPKRFDIAVNQIPRFLKELAKSSFLSLHFNLYISKRTTELEQPIQGERRQIFRKRRNIEVALPSRKWNKCLNQIWEEVLKKTNTRLEIFKNFKHSSRFAFLYPEALEMKLHSENVILKFFLPSGSYATVLLREIMREEGQYY